MNILDQIIAQNTQYWNNVITNSWKTIIMLTVLYKTSKVKLMNSDFMLCNVAWKIQSKFEKSI